MRPPTTSVPTRPCRDASVPKPRPPPFAGLLPGIGRTTPGQVEFHPYVGEERPRVEVIQSPDPGWAEMLRQHVDYHFQAVPAYGIPDQCFEACQLCLGAWPRGTGKGELLDQPVVDDTPPRHRGVSAEWWLEVAQRAPFVPTRIFVEAFVKPVTEADKCALWFYVPVAYREKPDVFVSHAWDLSMWDIRPDPGCIMWLDTIAIVQHRKANMASAADAFPELQDLVPTLQSIANTLLILGGNAHGLLPLARSWCCYELAHTPTRKLRVRVGWSNWNFLVQKRIREEIDALDMAQAAAFDMEDKQRIDGIIVKKFGSFARANEFVRASVLHAYFVAVFEAFIDRRALECDIEMDVARVHAAGQRPLLDKQILRLFADAVDGSKATSEELRQAESLQEYLESDDSSVDEEEQSLTALTNEVRLHAAKRNGARKPTCTVIIFSSGLLLLLAYFALVIVLLINSVFLAPANTETLGLSNTVDGSSGT